MSKIGKSVCSKVTTALLLVALGIIYGDIGTSPLYALHAVVGEREITKTLLMMNGGKKYNASPDFN